LISGEKARVRDFLSNTTFLKLTILSHLTNIYETTHPQQNSVIYNPSIYSRDQFTGGGSRSADLERLVQRLNRQFRRFTPIFDPSTLESYYHQRPEAACGKWGEGSIESD
jgi:hypothetical protein